MSNSTRCRSAWPVRSLVALTLASLSGPPSSEAQRPSFEEEVDVDLVNVDVVVVDKKGQLVTDLGPDDFQITDDGKKVDVGYFARLTAGLAEPAATGVDGGTAAAASASAAAPTAGGSADAPAAQPTAAGREPRRLIVFVDVDSGELLNRNRLLDDLSEYLGSHAEETTAMVVTYGGTGLDVKLPFSTSPAEWKSTLDAIMRMASRGVVRASEQQRLVESIKQIQRHGDSTQSLQAARDQLDELIGSVRTESESMRMDGRATLRALQTLVSVLSTVEGPKSLLYVGDGVPVHPGQELYNLLSDVFEGDRRFAAGGGSAVGSSSPGAGEGSGDEGGGGGGSFAGVSPGVAPMTQSPQTLRTDAMSLDLTPELRALTATANSHRVTIYGMSTDVQGGAGRADMNLGSRVSANAALTYDLSRSQVREQSLQLMADETGGLTLPRSAGVASFMDRVLADEGNRYSLAYVSPHGGDSRYHKIKVKVNRKGVELRHREGYIDRPRDVRVGDLVAGALLLGWTENPHQLEMEVVSQAPGENGETAVTLGLHIPIDQLRLVPAGEQHEAKLDLFILSKDAKGTFSPMRSVSFTVTLSPAQMAQSKGRFYGANLPLSLVNGPHAIAVGMVEPAAQRTSIVRTEIEVGEAAPASAPKG